FIHNSNYYMQVSAYDNAGNSSTRNVQVTYKVARPNNWTWHTPKVAGQPISLTASEWNSFCLRINQFRQYRGLQNYNFTTVYSGNIITASVINEARSAMSSMTSVPPLKTKDDLIFASHFTSLRE